MTVTARLLWRDRNSFDVAKLWWLNKYLKGQPWYDSNRGMWFIQKFKKANPHIYKANRWRVNYSNISHSSNFRLGQKLNFYSRWVVCEAGKTAMLKLPSEAGNWWKREKESNRWHEWHPCRWRRRGHSCARACWLALCVWKSLAVPSGATNELIVL